MNTHADAWRERMRAEGRCLTCGAARDSWQTTCATCRGKKAARRLREDPERRRARQNAYTARVRKARRAARRPDMRGAAVTAEAIAQARQALLDVRSDFTPAQLADLERVCVAVYRVGIDRGYAKGRQARYAEQAAQKGSAAA